MLAGNAGRRSLLLPDRVYRRRSCFLGLPRYLAARLQRAPPEQTRPSRFLLLTFTYFRHRQDSTSQLIGFSGEVAQITLLLCLHRPHHYYKTFRRHQIYSACLLATTYGNHTFAGLRSIQLRILAPSHLLSDSLEREIARVVYTRVRCVLCV